MEKELTMQNECYQCQNKKNILGDAHIQCGDPDKSMTGNAHGIRSGWFYYPFNFDPTWKTKKCSNFKLKKEKER